MKLKYKTLIKHWFIGFTITLLFLQIGYLLADESEPTYIAFLIISLSFTFYFTTIFSLIDYLLYFRHLKDGDVK
jgi:4-hydroxybenzoate polyprenyltransferase